MTTRPLSELLGEFTNPARLPPDPEHLQLRRELANEATIEPPRGECGACSEPLDPDGWCPQCDPEEDEQS